MDILMIVIVTIAIVIGLFLLFRQVTLWYFKINQHITMMAEQLKMMNKQTRLLEDIRD